MFVSQHTLCSLGLIDIKVEILGMFASAEETMQQVAAAVDAVPEPHRPYVWRKFLSFKNGKQSLKWKEHFDDPDFAARSFCSQFKRDVSGIHCSAKLLLVNCQTGSWVRKCGKDAEGVSEFWNSAWHVAALAIISDRNKKRTIVFFDVNRKGNVTRKCEILPAPVKELIKTFHLTNATLWVNKEHHQRAEGHHLQLSVQELEHWIKSGKQCWNGAEDVRIAGRRYEMITKT